MAPSRARSESNHPEIAPRLEEVGPDDTYVSCGIAAEGLFLIGCNRTAAIKAPSKEVPEWLRLEYGEYQGSINGCVATL